MILAARRVLFVFVIAMLVTGWAIADEPAGLELADLAAYRAAVEGNASGPAVAVTFRQLWERPQDYVGKRVRIEGRVARRFRQGAYGTFPPLVESWAVSPSGDPFCLVYPATAGEETPGKNDPAPGSSIRFQGVYLKRLKYQGGDADRLAPLIVGDRPPVVVLAAPPPVAETPGGRFSRLDWAIGLGAAILVALALARQHIRAPSRARLPQQERDPPPEFVDSA